MELVSGSSEWQLLVENNKVDKANKNIYVLVTDFLVMNFFSVLFFITINLI